MTCRYLGDDVRTYPAYRDLDTDRPLEAAPGGSYEIAPAGGLDLPVPPQDGRWETAGEPADDDGPGEGSALPPFPLMAGPGTEDEEN